MGAETHRVQDEWPIVPIWISFLNRRVHSDHFEIAILSHRWPRRRLETPKGYEQVPCFGYGGPHNPSATCRFLGSRGPSGAVGQLPQPPLRSSRRPWTSPSSPRRCSASSRPTASRAPGLNIAMLRRSSPQGLAKYSSEPTTDAMTSSSVNPVDSSCAQNAEPA